MLRRGSVEHLAAVDERQAAANCRPLAHGVLSVSPANIVCENCGVYPAPYHVKGLAYCRDCAWAENGSQQPDDDPDSEPPGAGADPYGRPDPQTHPEFWTE